MATTTLSRRIGIGAIVVLGTSLAACGSSADSTSTTTTSSVSVPVAPTIGTATAGNASATIAFTAPTATGGAAITGYTASCTGGGATRTGAGTASPITVSGLANGTSYSCSVTATNSAGTGAASAAASVTPAAAASTTVTTAAVDCPYSQSTYVASFGLTSTSSWTCSSTTRSLTANGIPDHATGPFSNPDLNFTMTTQSVSFSATLTPTLASATNTNAMALAYALNGVKIDPGTGGTCPWSATKTSDCSLLPGGTMGTWRIEALGQTTFDFGADANNAHVQPGGAYHYHGVPEGILTNNGVSSSAPKMLLIAFAPDGYPIYARYGRNVATDAMSALKVIRSSYSVKSTPDSGRPSTSIIPMGAFTQDYQYVAGSGDLDECNGRTDVTPEFPNGIYHYYATDTYPYMTRCWKGNIN